MKDATKLTRFGRPHDGSGLVNPPIERGSTMLAPSAGELYDFPPGKPHYGRIGLGAQRALSGALSELQGGAGCSLTPSGLMAMTLSLLSTVEAGGEVLAADCLYGPVRSFIKTSLAKHGVKARFYDPEIGEEIGDLITPDTQAIFLESPGSLTFEIQDIPAIAAIARDKGVTTMIDDTWSAGLIMKPLALGVDIAAQAVTKYVGGHSDLMLGAVVSRDEKTAARVEQTARAYGLHASPEDAWLALRGMRTLELRMTRSGQSSLEIARWLADRPETGQIRHPALPGAPGHDRWARFFTGSAGLFSFELPGWDVAKSEAFLDGMELFGNGFSWGGYESLAIHCDPQLKREATRRRHEGALIRLGVGLEAPEDLIADLEKGFEAVA